MHDCSRLFTHVIRRVCTKKFLMKIWLKDFDHLCLGIYHQAVSQCFLTTSILDVLVYHLKMDWAPWKYPADSTWEIFLINVENLFVLLCLIQEQVTNWSTNFDPLLKKCKLTCNKLQILTFFGHVQLTFWSTWTNSKRSHKFPKMEQFKFRKFFEWIKMIYTR